MSTVIQPIRVRASSYSEIPHFHAMNTECYSVAYRKLVIGGSCHICRIHKSNFYLTCILFDEKHPLWKVGRAFCVPALNWVYPMFMI